jgi:hypothetical protein
MMSTRCVVEEAIPDVPAGEEAVEEALCSTSSVSEIDEELNEKDLQLSMFLMKHLCEGCGGTLIPFPAQSMHACNMCNIQRPNAVYEAQLQMAMAEMCGSDSGSEEEEDSEGEQSDTVLG